MKKIINGSRVSFYDNNNNEIMYIDYPTDECIWCFNSNNVIIVNEDMELFECLMYLMKQQYTFSNNEILRSYKEDNTIVWYSDCYYNPDDDWSIKSVSYLTIEYIDNTFKVWCSKPLDEVIDRDQKFHCICFSPCGNGKYAKNNSNGLMLQDDFIFGVYHKLLKKEKIKKLSK